MNESNGIIGRSRGPMDGWWLTISQGKQLIGRVKSKLQPEPDRDRWTVLCPVLAFGLMPVQRDLGNGMVERQMTFTAEPVLYLISLTDIAIPPYSMWIDCGLWDQDEQREAAGAIARCQEMIQNTKAARGGIAVVSSLPPMPVPGRGRS